MGGSPAWIVQDGLGILGVQGYSDTGVVRNTVVSRISPRFATLVLVESVGGGLYAGSDILSREYAPFSGTTDT